MGWIRAITEWVCVFIPARGPPPKSGGRPVLRPTTERVWNDPEGGGVVLVENSSFGNLLNSRVRIPLQTREKTLYYILPSDFPTVRLFQTLNLNMWVTNSCYDLNMLWTYLLGIGIRTSVFCWCNEVLKVDPQQEPQREIHLFFFQIHTLYFLYILVRESNPWWWLFESA